MFRSDVTNKREIHCWKDGGVQTARGLQASVTAQREHLSQISYACLGFGLTLCSALRKMFNNRRHLLPSVCLSVRLSLKATT